MEQRKGPGEDVPSLRVEKTSWLVILELGFLYSKAVQKEVIGGSLVATLKKVWPAELLSEQGSAQGGDSAQRKHVMVTVAQLKEAEESA